ncbi:hypothetical protein BJV77DRAFT_1010956, partial [Russula vinacea]
CTWRWVTLLLLRWRCSDCRASLVRNGVRWRDYTGNTWHLPLTFEKALQQTCHYCKSSPEKTDFDILGADHPTTQTFSTPVQVTHTVVTSALERIDTWPRCPLQCSGVS